jgi:hypothetical protein
LRVNSARSGVYSGAATHPRSGNVAVMGPIALFLRVRGHSVVSNVAKALDLLKRALESADGVTGLQKFAYS